MSLTYLFEYGPPLFPTSEIMRAGGAVEMRRKKNMGICERLRALRPQEGG